MIATDHGPRTTDHGPRTGFTLIELLVVIAIIAVLISLLSSAVFKGIDVANKVSNQSTISNMSVAVEAFKKQYGVKYLPAKIRLKEQVDQYNMADLVEKDSITFLRQMFPRMNTAPGATINWNGDATPGNSDELLEGDQVLVFLLGGIPAQSSPGTTGFSTNPLDPSAHILGGGGVKPVNFEFKSNRLVKIHPGSSYYSYQDEYGGVYAYYSSTKASNDYDRYGNDCAFLSTWVPPPPPRMNLPTAPALLTPFVEIASPRTFFNRDGFQIISAGRDRYFNTPDDQTNFSQ